METENISRVTETTKSRKQQKTEIICPDCGQIFDPTIAKSTICITCLSKNMTFQKESLNKLFLIGVDIVKDIRGPHGFTVNQRVKSFWQSV